MGFSKIFVRFCICIGISFGLLTYTDAFANPKSEFLLEIDGNSISSGREHVCAIQQKQGTSIGGRVKCWGEDSFHGRLDAPTDIDFVQVVASQEFSCGISVEQNVYCWGSIKGQIPGLFSQLSASSEGYFACGVMIDGKLKCWGSYHTNQIPPEDESIRFLQISCSDRHCCALDGKGYPHCWGSGSKDLLEPPKITYAEYLESKKNSGWIVRPDTEDEYADEDESASSNDLKNLQTSSVQFRQISVGFGYNCGITLLGAHLQCWGDAPIIWVQKIPKKVQGPFRQVSVGGMGVCAIKADPNEMTPTSTEDEEGESQIGTVTSKEHKPDSLECWGPGKGHLNLNRFEAWDQISLGSNFICGVSMDSEVECGGLRPFMDHKDIIIA